MRNKNLIPWYKSYLLLNDNYRSRASSSGGLSRHFSRPRTRIIVITKGKGKRTKSFHCYHDNQILTLDLDRNETKRIVQEVASFISAPYALSNGPRLFGFRSEAREKKWNILVFPLLSLSIRALMDLFTFFFFLFSFLSPDVLFLEHSRMTFIPCKNWLIFRNRCTIVYYIFIA